MANQANLEATLAAIEANPAHWDQTTWHCGTSHCFAGFAELLRLQCDPTETSMVRLGLCDVNATREWLGLSPKQFDAITDSGNSLDDLREMVAKGVPDALWWCIDEDYDDWGDDDDDDDW